MDSHKALRAFSACMRSWEPKYEHKKAGCAFLLSEWFNLERAPATETTG